MSSNRAPGDRWGCMLDSLLVGIGAMFIASGERAINGAPWVQSGGALIVIGIVLGIPHLRAEVHKRAMLRSESAAARGRRDYGPRPLR